VVDAQWPERPAMNPLALAGLLALPWAIVTLGLAIFSTLGIAAAICCRLDPMWDRTEGLPSWDTIVPAAIVPAILWLGAIEAFGRVF
jgi:hypothetical protein